MDINLNNVESDLNKSTNVNTDQASNTKYPSVKAVFDWATNLLSGKVDKITGKGLSENDFTNTLKTKLDGIEAGAEVNVNADWNATNGDAQILNKPTIPDVTGLVPYTGATADVDLDTFGLDAKFIKIKGTGGNGHLNLKHQSSDATAGGSESVIYADNTGNPKWKNDGNAVQNVMLENSAITGATKTKITYDSKGLVTAGADATTADIADSTDKRYVTDAQLTVIGNTSGTNTGDQTLSGLGGVPTTRTITINGTTQNLSADRTFSAVMLTGLPGVANVGTSGAIRYFTFSGVATATVETTRRIIICNNVTLKNFYIYTSTAQPATGSHVLTVLKNGVATNITVTIASGSAAGLFSDTTNSESFAQGDAISIQAINNASTNSCTIVSFQIGSL